MGSFVNSLVISQLVNFDIFNIINYVVEKKVKSLYFQLVNRKNK